MQHRARGRSSDAELRYVARIVLSVRPSHKTMLKTGPTHGDGPTTSSALKSVQGRRGPTCVAPRKRRSEPRPEHKKASLG